MGKFLSLDIRERVALLVDSGHSRRSAARHFGVSESAAIKLLRRRKATGTVSPLPQGRPRGSGKLSPYMPFLIAQVEEKPDITMPELAGKLDQAYGVRVPPSSLSSALVAQGFTYKTLETAALMPSWASETTSLTPHRPLLVSLRRNSRGLRL